MNIQHNWLTEDCGHRSLMIEIFLIIAICIAAYALSARFDLLESIVEFSWRHESWEIDELLTVTFFLSISLLVFWIRRWYSLRKAFSEIVRLRGILPICAACKKIRDDQGYWHQVEAYISEHSEAVFSHSICPDCMQEKYPEYARSSELAQE